MDLFLIVVLGIMVPAVIILVLRRYFSVPAHLMLLLFFVPPIASVAVFQAWLKFAAGGLAMGLDPFVYPIALILFGPWSLALSIMFWALGNVMHMGTRSFFARLILFAAGGPLTGGVAYSLLFGMEILFVQGAHRPGGTQGVAGVLAFLFDGFLSGLIVAACLEQPESARKSSVVLA